MSNGTEASKELTMGLGRNGMLVFALVSCVVIGGIHYISTEKQSLPAISTDEFLSPRPLVTQPVHEELDIKQLVPEEPVVKEPVHEDPVIKEPVLEKAVHEEPVITQPVIAQPSNNTFLKPSTPSPLSDDVTLVTAFFNIGNFQKGEGTSYFTPDLYHNWMKVLGNIQNPIAFYFDTEKDIEFVKNLRKDLDPSLSKIVHLNRTTMWAFGDLRDRIAEIYSQPSYPKHHPNTVVPEYSCAMHGKYEVMSRTIKENPFRTKYFAWLDIGLFRHLNQSTPFKLSLPPNFDPKKVAYTEVHRRSEIKTAEDIFLQNNVWVCGCFFIAEGSVMMTWVQEYMNATEHFLEHHVMNTDQQIIYSMFVQKNFDFRPRTQLQLYNGDGRFSQWFHLGYVCKEEGEKLARLPNSKLLVSSQKTQTLQSSPRRMAQPFN